MRFVCLSVSVVPPAFKIRQSHNPLKSAGSIYLLSGQTLDRSTRHAHPHSHSILHKPEVNCIFCTAPTPHTWQTPSSTVLWLLQHRQQQHPPSPPYARTRPLLSKPHSTTTFQLCHPSPYHTTLPLQHTISNSQTWVKHFQSR